MAILPHYDHFKKVGCVYMCVCLYACMYMCVCLCVRVCVHACCHVVQSLYSVGVFCHVANTDTEFTQCISCACYFLICSWI